MATLDSITVRFGIRFRVRLALDCAREAASGTVADPKVLALIAAPYFAIRTFVFVMWHTRKPMPLAPRADA